MPSGVLCPHPRHMPLRRHCCPPGAQQHRSDPGESSEVQTELMSSKMKLIVNSIFIQCSQAEK